MNRQQTGQMNRQTNGQNANILRRFLPFFNRRSCLTDRKTNRQMDRKTNRQMNRQTDRDRQTDRPDGQRDKQTET